VEDAHIRVASMEQDENGRGTILDARHLPDGWIIEFMRGQYYAATVHRTIAGTPWACDLVVPTRSALSEDEKLCLSIRSANAPPGTR